VYLVDGRFRIREVNPAALPMFANIPDVIGRDFDDVIHILWPKAYADEIVAHFRHTLETREPYVVSERVEERLDTGHTEYYEWRIECIPLPDGDGVVCYFRDISEQVLARQSIQDSDRRKDEFLALLAHELRNPLAPIRTGLELIRLSGDTPQSVARVRSMMERQVNQMVRLIDDLLDVSRIASGKIVLQRTPTALTELVQSAIEAHRIVIESAKIALVVDLTDDSCVVDVDPTRFVQILSNVLHNASKFTPAGGTIRCSAATRARGGSSEAVITVSDTGIGISRAMLPRIFDLFTQAEQPTKRAHGGLGIGLALARRLVGMHDGTITGHSDGLDQGTTFVITVPVFQGIASQATPRLDVPRLAIRVVIVDDNRDAAIAMSMLIDQLGGSTRIAHDAEGGLAAIEAFEPDIVFLDIGMPGVDGYEACRRIRQHPSLRHVVVVAVTGWGQAQDKQRALDAGFDAHLTKPVDPTALADVLASLPRR
jgi:signal transduction histidine kinase/CheY-like chemotaxis protein